MPKEIKRKRGVGLRYPESVYVMAHDLYLTQKLTAIECARRINAKEICDHLDSQQIRYMALIGERLAQDNTK